MIKDEQSNVIQIKAEYIKEWAETYLQVPCEVTQLQEYQEKMLYYNPGNGFLESSKEVIEGQTYYRYRVTGKKAWHSIYGTVPIKEQQVRSFLQQIITILETGREYLLSEDSFLLSPNYIFTKLPKQELQFCYVPGYHMPLMKQLENLMEYLLNRVDYEDKKAVEVLYDCYLLCVRDGAGLKEMKQRLFQGIQNVNSEHKQEQKENQEDTRRNEQINRQDREQGVKRTEPLEPLSYTSWLSGLFHRKKPGKEVFYSLEKPDIVVPTIAEEKTVLLSSKTSVRPEEKQPQLLNEKTGELIFLNKSPFTIGTMEHYADYVLNQKGISRLHCCITEKVGGFYLSDLNSTNGTYLNQIEVMPGTQKQLIPNDVIKIAKEEFVFLYT